MYVNAKAELVTLAPGLRPERRFAPLARGLNIAYMLHLKASSHIDDVSSCQISFLIGVNKLFACMFVKYSFFHSLKFLSVY